MEDVHKHADVVNDDPLANREAVYRRRPLAEPLLELVLDLAGDGFEVRFAGARADQVIIRDRRNTAQIERGDVDGFFLGGVKRALLDDFFGGDGGGPPYGGDGLR